MCQALRCGHPLQAVSEASVWLTRACRASQQRGRCSGSSLSSTIVVGFYHCLSFSGQDSLGMACTGGGPGGRQGPL